ncbi:hypothetical protein IBX65_07765 [Candidatus Aerophobetes bacterium]|nr:hypothetical protein [Candidatus Aerophobetes bacterium]
MPQKKSNRKRISSSLHILGYKENDKYIAHCLEFDIVSEGTTHKEAIENLKELVYSYLQFAMEYNLEQFTWKPAPKIFWDTFNKIHKKKAEPPSILSKTLLRIRKEQLGNVMEEAQTQDNLTYA